ncbi:MAG: nitroreductase family protein [Chloroflexota bacterium]|nr:nitroreductase family protein [Chloroflexota bacterium]
MDVFETVSTILAVRAYQPTPVSPEKIRLILDAGRLTGSASNQQPWHFIVVDEPTDLQKLAELARSGPYLAQAPVAIVVVIERTPLAVSDGSRAIQSMLLTAWAEGIGSNWVGYNVKGVNSLLNIPDNLDVLAILPLGYPVKQLGQGKKNRKAISEVFSYGKYGNPLG